MNAFKRITCLVMVFCVTEPALAQTTSSELLGAIRDSAGAVILQATVRVRNIDTNQSREIQSNEGGFRFTPLDPGRYELSVEKTGFDRYVRSGIILQLNQRADLGNLALQLSGPTKTELTVTADVPLINTTNAEVGANFNAKRIGEFPVATDHNVLNLVLSVAGVSQLSVGNTEHAASMNFSANGARLRSNDFIIDGQDSNNLNSTGLVQELNNPDTIAELRVITNQFGAEFGRASGSVVNMVTKSGTNQFHGTGYWFYNGNKLNARSNLDKRLFESAPWRIEDQFGATLGGPVIKNRTFFFGSALRWTDHQVASGQSITGVPTAEGQNILRSLAGDRPQVQVLLSYLPPAQTTPGITSPLTVAGQTAQIPLGTLSGAAPNQLDVWQFSGRVDHHFNEKNIFGGRYLFDDRLNIGGQAAPPGLMDQTPQRRQALSLHFTRFAPTWFNELRTSYQRNASNKSGIDPRAEEIPSIEITGLGLTGFSSGSNRTGIGLATNLPSFSRNNNFHISDVMGLTHSTHSMKLGMDVRRLEQYYLLGSAVRGRLVYEDLQHFVDDLAQQAGFSTGGNQHDLRYMDFGFFIQDEWRAKPNLTLTYGVRYESPGTPNAYLEALAQQILAAHNNDPLYAFGPSPKRDTNNWAPRIGFNYRLRNHTELVFRGGYSRTYDQSFNQIYQNIAGAFPFTPTINVPVQNAFANIAALRAGTTAPEISTANLRKTTVAPDFRSPLAEQFSLQIERAFGRDWALSVGWIATKGTGLLQTVDANPTLPTSNNKGSLRVDPTQGAVRLRCNCASSIYHSLQTSLEKRISVGFSAALHYTWSAFIDDTSDVFNASADGDIAIAEDSFNRHADRGRSTYDRPHRFAANWLLEIPSVRQIHGLERVLGGWQLSGFLTLQSGAPFSPLNGSDPGFRLTGITAQVGNSIRPNLNTGLDLSSMSIEEIVAAGGRSLFSPVTAASPIGNAGRNILRADGIANVAFGLNRNFSLKETSRLQLRAEFYNAFNSRDFGIPEAVITNPGFGLQWDKDGGNRRVVLGLRYSF